MKKCMNCGEEMLDMLVRMHGRVILCEECFESMNEIFLECSECSSDQPLSEMRLVSFQRGMELVCNSCLTSTNNANFHNCQSCGMVYYDEDDYFLCWICEPSGLYHTEEFISPRREFNLSKKNLRVLNNPSTEL